MRDSIFRINVFEKSDSSQERNGRGKRQYEDLMPENRLFLKRMRALAEEDLVRLAFQIRKWPVPTQQFESVGDPAVIVPIADESRRYSFLDHPDYDADFAVCFGRTLHEFGPEIAHMIHERKKHLHHVLLATQQPLSSDWDETKQGFHPVVAHSFRRDGSQIHEPYIDEAMRGEDLISFFDIPSTYRNDTAERLQRILCA